jgi:CheY-like chemotaxis protein
MSVRNRDREEDMEQLGVAQAPRVLVVDDDPILGAAIVRILEPAFKVTFAQSAAGALGRVSPGARFAAIVSDVSIPGMSGMELYDEVARLDPALARRIVFVSGTAAEDPVFQAFLDRTRVPFLPKPFDRSELLKLVSSVASRADWQTGSGSW